jgi:hypothetical protein
MSKSKLNVSTVEALDLSEAATIITRPAQPEAAPDPFDLGRLRLSGSLNAGAAVKKQLTTIPCKKPSKEWFVRVHPTHKIETCVIELKEDSEIYLVDPSLWDELSGESTFGARALYLAQNKQGVNFVWPIRLPGPDGRLDDWSRSSLEAAEFASKQWCRVQSNRSLGAYEIFTAAAQWAEPEWPDLPLKEILRLAFRDKHITTADHPVLKRLRGEA